MLLLTVYECGTTAEALQLMLINIEILSSLESVFLCYVQFASLHTNLYVYLFIHFSCIFSRRRYLLKLD